MDEATMPRRHKGKKTLPYHVSGLRRLRYVIDSGYGTAGILRFREHVEMSSQTKIPKNHKAWRREIRRGAEMFVARNEPYVGVALDKLLAEEKAARKKRADKLAEDMEKGAAAGSEPADGERQTYRSPNIGPQPGTQQDGSRKHDMFPAERFS